MSPNAITKPKGFLAAGISCGIKISGKKDLALIYSQVPALGCGLFTSNKVKAAPLLVTAGHLRKGTVRAIVINSGNANCFTGKQGLVDAKKMSVVTANFLGINESEVLVASTGIIGKPMPMQKIIPGIKELCSRLSRARGKDAASAIRTTDTFSKEIAKSFKVGLKTVTIGAMAKGAGMIFPHLADSSHATMLCFIATDACIQIAALKAALKQAVEYSFNAISVDGCMSTNDMVLILANAAAKNKPIKINSQDYGKFCAGLTAVCKDLAKKIVLDAEGATKFIQIHIKGAHSAPEARQAAFAIANSNLFKTACFGENRNVGRVIAAVGAAGIPFNQQKASLRLSSLKSRFINLEVNLGQGKSESVVYTSDLSPAYVHINAGYS